MITALTNWLASRPRKVPISTIVLHATDGASAGSSISWLRKIGLSYHYVIERDGSVTKCVPVSRVAFHAGKSFGPQGSDVNPYSIGISLANLESHREPITQKQIDALDDLVGLLCDAEPDIKWITTHYWISPGRKTDPKMLPVQNIMKIATANKLRMWRGV
jgi:N-acetyl-anhydromuramyl-L-alanine amidase AmpD